MIVYAAIDLRGGQAVQLVGGRTDAQRIALPDPVAVVQKWQDAGFRALHVVDLDAALGEGDNRDRIAEILDVATVPVQVGGGIRSDEAVADLLNAGAALVIVGTRAIEDAPWLERMALRYPEQLVVAADVRDDFVVTRGWTAQTELPIATLLHNLADVPIAGVLITDVGREGQMGGVDVAKFRKLVQGTSLSVTAAGGIRDIADLHALAEAGVDGAVLGMALYTGAVDARAVTANFP